MSSPAVEVVDVADRATLVAMDEVMQRAYGVASFAHSVARFAGVQPDGLAVVRRAGEVVAAGACIAYRDAGFGWVGLVATDPRAQRQGLATLVTQHLIGVLGNHGCAAVLDASAAGAPVYERMGFADFGLATVLEAPAEIEVGPDAVATGSVDDVATFDCAAFGADRRALLSVLAGQHADRLVVARRGSTVVGYALGQLTSIGPAVAVDADALRSVLYAVTALPFTATPRLNVPSGSGHVAALLVGGWAPLRQLRHMRLGIAELPGRRELLAAQVSLGEG